MKTKIIRISESGNSAMVGISQNERNSGNILAYVGLLTAEKKAVKAGTLNVGDELEFSDDFELITKQGDDNQTMCYPDTVNDDGETVKGSPIKFLQFNS